MVIGLLYRVGPFRLLAMGTGNVARIEGESIGRSHDREQRCSTQTYS